MAGDLTLRVLTPEKIVTDCTASSVRVPGVDGSIGILPRHAPMVAALDPGLLRYRANGAEVEMFVAGGFAEVRDNTVRVLTAASERAQDIDVERAREAEARARERLAVQREEARVADIDFLRAEAALRRAIMRLQVAGKAGR